MLDELRDKAYRYDPIRVIDLRAYWDREPAPPEFIIERYLPAGVVTLLSGHGGAGKTSLALAMAAHVAAGEPFAGLEVIRSPVAFGSLEDGPELVHLRLRRIVDAYGLDAGAVLDNFTLVDGSTGDAVLAREDSGVLSGTPTYEALADAADGHRLIILDNASDAYGGNENARAEVRGFMRLLAGLARRNNAAVVLLAHIDKASAKVGGSGQTYSGSTAWHNSARSRLSLVLEDDNVHLYHEKSNLGPLADPLQITFNNRGVPMPMPQLSLLEESFRDLIPAFEAAQSSGATVYDNLHAGSYSAYATLEQFPEYPRKYHGRAGRKLAARGITQLIREGALVREEYRKADRKRGKRIVLAQPLPQEAKE